MKFRSKIRADLAGFRRIGRKLAPQKELPPSRLYRILAGSSIAALLLLSMVRMIIDYARIAVVADSERKALKALRHAFKFIGKRFFRAWAIYLLLAVLSLAGMVLFHFVFNRLGTPGVGWVAAGLVWMQLYVLFRIWIRTLFVAAQAEYYRAHPY